MEAVYDQREGLLLDTGQFVPVTKHTLCPPTRMIVASMLVPVAFVKEAFVR